MTGADILRSPVGVCEAGHRAHVEEGYLPVNGHSGRYTRSERNVIEGKKRERKKRGIIIYNHTCV